MLTAEIAVLGTALLGYLATPSGRRQSCIFVSSVVALCTGRSLEVVEQADASLRLRFYREGSGLKITTRRYRIEWETDDDGNRPQ